MDNNAQSAKIKELAQTLRKNGLAGSDSEAMRMAETMTTTEDRVNKNFEEKKSSMVRNYDFEKAKQNGTATYGNNPSTGIKSQIANATSTSSYPKTTEQSSEQQPSIQQETEVQTWEKEEATQTKSSNQNAVPQQMESASVSPPINTCGGINNAISNVQERFAQQREQQVNPELPMGLTLNEASTNEQQVERNVPQVPETKAPVAEQQPVQEQIVEQSQVTVEPQQAVQQEIPVEQSTAPVVEHPSMTAQETPTAEPKPVAAEQQAMQETSVEQQAVQQAPQQEAPQQAKATPVVEQSLPRPLEQAQSTQQAVQETPVEQQAVQQAPQQEAPQQAEATPIEKTPVKEEEEEMVEKTQEMPSNLNPQRDTSKFAESKIDLADVFNVNNNKRM